MVTMWQAGTVTKGSLPGSLNTPGDVGMAKEDAKVHLVLVLNQDTLSHLDAYTTMHMGDEMAHLEIIQDRLCHVPYIQMLAYLK